MSLNKYNKQLHLDLKPSSLLYFFILFVHILALTVLTLNLNIPVAVLIVFGILIFISLYSSLKKNNSINLNTYIEKIHYLKDMQWCLIDSENKSTIVELQDNWFSLPWLLILYFKNENNKNQSIVILPDMINKNDIRRLKLHLNKIKS